VSGWRQTSYHEPVAPASLYSAVWQGPANQSRVGRPRSGRETKGPSGRLGPLMRSF
jgi:hypothetical protein